DVESFDRVSALAQSRMIEVHGQARMRDYDRLATLLANFNKLGEAIAYSILKSPDAAAALDKLKAALNQVKGDKKLDVKRTINQMGDPKSYAKTQGLHQDEQLIANLKLISDLFLGDTLEFQFVPECGELRPIFRALLKKEFLRIPPD